MPKAGKHPDRKLTAVTVRSLTKPGRYADGGGLYLVVEPSGAKRWIQRLMIQGKRCDLGLGGLQTVSLAEAREKALTQRRSARSGGNPLVEQRAARRIIPTFAQAIDPVHAEQRKSWKNEKHGNQWRNALQTYAVPTIGQKRIDQIQIADIIELLKPIWIEKPETARRVRQRLSTIFQWAKANGFRRGENPVENVEMGLARQSKTKAHFAALPYRDLPGFMLALEKGDAGEIAKLAFRFLILTAARTGEVLGAQWPEIDLEAEIWTVPAVRMKMGREHRVPLSPPAVEALRRAREVSDDPVWVFPGQRAGRPLSGMVFLMTLRRMGVPVTAHGFRSAFSDWVSEETAFPSDVRQMALAHIIKNRVEAAYRRGDLFEKRKNLMLVWAEYLYGVSERP